MKNEQLFYFEIYMYIYKWAKHMYCSFPGESPVQGLGQPCLRSRPCGYHVEQLPFEPPPHVPVRRRHRSNELRVQVRQGLRRWHP